ncbi:MAG: hypothetical protein ACLP2Y_09810 [Limisphaerales bacterium]
MDNASFKLCPFCKEQIRKEAVKCRFCGEWLEQQASPPPSQPQEAKATEALTHPKSENFPTHEPQTEQKQLRLDDAKLGESVFRDLVESLNLNPSREQWEYEFLERKKPQNPIPPEIMDMLWKDSSDAGRKAKSSTCENAELPLPTADERKATTPTTVKKEIPLKTLNWISAVLLLVCGLVLFIGLAAIPWNQLSPDKQGDVTEKLAGVFTRALICAGLLAWSVKRKGYRLLTFSVVCAVMTAIFACYFHIGKQQSEQQTQESNAKMVENFQGIFSNELKSVQQGATGNFSNNIKPTGDAENDAVLLWANNLSKEITQYVGNMNEEISALQEQDVFDTSLLTNKSSLKVEIPKRIEHQKIIKKYKDGWLPMLEATKEKFTPVNISEKVKNQILQGTETSIQSNSAQAELLFGLLLKTDQAELNFLQFMVGSYDDYQFKGGTISFGSAANSQKYEELTKSIQGAMRNEETFREQHLKAAEDSIQQLRNEFKK